MSRQPRTLYHAQVTLAHDGFSYIVDESHSYDQNDSIWSMMQEAQRIIATKNYTATFNENNLSYIISRSDWTTYATLRLVSTDDGIDLIDC
jgi:type IV secretory pathway VirB9-like protein